MTTKSFIFALLCSQVVIASDITWNAISPANDLNTPGNWLPATTPTAVDNALFDSSIVGIAINPTATTNFSVLSLNFINTAKPFSFAFNNCSLTFAGIGIQGAQTNTSISLSNIDNPTSLGNQIFYSDTSGSSGASSITFLNSATLGGASTGTSRSDITGPQLSAAGQFTMSTGGTLSFTNQGTDNTTDLGNNILGRVNGQARIAGSLICDTNNSLIFVNSGLNNNTTNPTESSSFVGICNGQQLFVGQDLHAGNSFVLSASNTGVDNTVGVGPNNTGVTASSQIQVDGEFTVGNNATITVSNSGTNSSSGLTSLTGFVAGNQFVVSEFTAGNNFTLTATNTGINTGFNNSNVGFASNDLVNFASSFTALDNATISITNSGSNTQGSETVVGSTIRFLLESGGPFIAGDNFKLTVSNSGTDTSTGVSNVVGSTSNGYEAYFASDLTLGKNANILVSNFGSYTGTDVNASIGFTQDQFLVSGTFTAGENLSLRVTNDAFNPNHAGVVGQTINQLIFLGPCNLNNGSLLSATNSNDAAVGNQMYFGQGFTLNGKATFQAINTGSAGNGIMVNASTGGNINVILQNTSFIGLNSTISTPFTMGALNGDATSTATCDPGITINTDTGVNALFAGTLFDFMGIPLSLVKDGPGTQTLSGSNTFLGPTTVQGGTLVVNGSLAGPLQVTSLGTLKGTGSIAGDVINSGTIAPGQSIGTITFLSTFTNNGGTYDVEVSGAGQSDLISVAGAATLNGGQVIVSSPDGTFRIQQPYTILQAGSLTGTFTGATSAALVRPTLTYDLQRVFLTLSSNITSAAVTSNQRVVAQQIDGITNPTPDQQLLINSIINLPAPAARTALTSLSGYQHTFDLLTTGIVNRQFIRRLYDPLRFIVSRLPDCCCDPCCCNEFSIWLEGGGSHTHISGDRNCPGLSLNGLELTLGLQDTFCQDFTLGVAGSFDYEHFHFKKEGGSGQSKTWLVGAYGLYRPSCFYGLLDFAYGYSSNTLRRRINLGGLRSIATSEPNTHQFTFYGELGLDFCACDLLLQPFIGVETNHYHRRRVREHNPNNWGLTVRDRERTSTFLRVGGHFTNTCQIPGDIDVSVDLAWNGRLSNGNNKVNAQFNTFGTPFKVNGVKISSNSVDYAITFSTDFCNCWRAWLQGSGETWNHAQEFGFLAGIEMTW